MAPFDRSHTITSSCYLVSFARSSELLVEFREFFIPHLYLVPPLGVPRLNFAKMFDTHKTRMIGLSCGEKNFDNMLSHFHRITERDGRTDRQTNGQTELLYQYRTSVC